MLDFRDWTYSYILFEHVRSGNLFTEDKDNIYILYICVKHFVNLIRTHTKYTCAYYTAVVLRTIKYEIFSPVLR